MYKLYRVTGGAGSWAVEIRAITVLLTGDTQTAVQDLDKAIAAAAVDGPSWLLDGLKEARVELAARATYEVDQQIAKYITLSQRIQRSGRAAAEAGRDLYTDPAALDQWIATLAALIQRGETLGPGSGSQEQLAETLAELKDMHHKITSIRAELTAGIVLAVIRRGAANNGY